jgi:hypothetical protein
MDRENLRNTLHKFNEIRKSYSREKKRIIFEHFANLSETFSVKELQESFHNEFRDFSRNLPETLRISSENLDDDLIFWYCFELEDSINASEIIPETTEISEDISGTVRKSSGAILNRKDWLILPKI